jgi:hypothetical protein
MTTMQRAQAEYDAMEDPRFDDRSYPVEPQTREYSIHGCTYRVSGYKDCDGDSVYKVEHWALSPYTPGKPSKRFWSLIQKDIVGWDDCAKLLREIFEDDLGRGFFED